MNSIRGILILFLVLFVIYITPLSTIDDRHDISTLRKKIGQLFIVGFDTPESLFALIEDYPPGGIILFNRNIPSLKDLRKLVEKLERVYAEKDLPSPFIAVDHEGGGVFRFFSTEITQPPSQEALGLVGEEQFVELFAKSSACELSSAGINMILGPVFETWSNPCSPIRNRSFSRTPEIAKHYTEITSTIYNESGLVPVVKHFPNLGSSHTDSHGAFPIVHLKETKSFLFDNFVHRIGMISHTIIPELDTTLPASLSLTTSGNHEVFDRKALRMTDDLSMVLHSFSIEKASQLAWDAGNSLILIGANTSLVRPAMEQILRHVMHDLHGEHDVEQRINPTLKIRTALAQGHRQKKSHCNNATLKTTNEKFSRLSLRSLSDLSQTKELLKKHTPDLLVAISPVTYARAVGRGIKKVELTQLNADPYSAIRALTPGNVAVAEVSLSFVNQWNDIVKETDPSILLIGLVPDSISLRINSPKNGAIIFSSSLTLIAREALVDSLFDDLPIKQFRKDESLRCEVN